MLGRRSRLGLQTFMMILSVVAISMQVKALRDSFGASFDNHRIAIDVWVALFLLSAIQIFLIVRSHPQA